MAKKKLPYLQFYPGDWLKDPIAGCSLATQGLWLRMMMVAHESDRYGHLSAGGIPIPQESIAKRCGCDDLTQFETLLAELDRAKVPSRTKSGIIYSRRMDRDQKKRDKWRRDKENQRNPNPVMESVHQLSTDCPPALIVNPLSLSEEKKTPPTPSRGVMARFEEFYSSYPKKRNRGDAEKAWRGLKPDVELLCKMLEAVAWQVHTYDWVKEGGQFIPLPGTWLRGKRWLDEPPAKPQPAPPEPKCQDCGHPEKIHWEPVAGRINIPKGYRSNKPKVCAVALQTAKEGGSGCMCGLKKVEPVEVGRGMS